MKRDWLGGVLLATGLSGFVSACPPPLPPRDVDWIASGKSEMVAADAEQASQAGLEILQAGGNAIDAAVAVSFALAVTRPYSTGLGGGGFMIARFADGRIVVQDFRETAPAAAAPDMFVQLSASRPDKLSPSEFGHLAVAVPGLVAGRCQALAEWGTLSLEKVLQPAIRLAREGYPVDEDYVRTTQDVLESYNKHPSLADSCGYVHRTHLRGGSLRQKGDRLIQPELGRLLEGLAAEGPDLFYKGTVAAAIVREMKKHGGILTEVDLANYQPKIREPIISTYCDYELILMPSPSSGGIALAETLNILENFPRPPLPRHDMPDYHLQIEAMKHAFADRAVWLGDQDFVDVPTKRLLSKSYAAALARQIDYQRVSEIKQYGSAGL
ncbi:MAG: gamma-glutamyltransferase, partial [Phycisphaerales bacterium]|nr:gamma-glutamyltransferase [Phycisphaerales bacterium]